MALAGDAATIVAATAKSIRQEQRCSLKTWKTGHRAPILAPSSHDALTLGLNGLPKCNRIAASCSSCHSSYKHMRRVILLAFSLLSAPLLAQKPLIVGYLPQWGLYGAPPWSARQLITSGSAALLDQVNYAQAFIVDGHCSVADPNADLQHPYTAETSVDGTADAPGPPAPGAPMRGEFHQLQELQHRYPHIRMLISLEGKPSAFVDAAQPEKRAAFVASCIDMFLRGNLAPGITAPGLFSGIDMDWEYPNGANDGANFNGLIVEFRKQLDAYAAATGTHPLLTIASAPGLGRYPGVDWPLVAKNVDQVGLMNYDYNGPWQKMTGIIAPLYSIPGVQRESGNVDGTVRDYEEAGVPAAKLLLGIPFYGYHWSQVTDAGAQHGLGVAGQADHSDTPYREIAAMPGAATVYRDAHSQAPWIYEGGTFWTFDDPVSATAKAEYTRDQQLGGMMIWELSGDTDDGSLMKAMHRGLAPSTALPGRKPGTRSGDIAVSP